MTEQPEPDSLRDQLCDAFIRLIRDYADRSIIAPGYMADTALAVVQPVIDDLATRATQQAELLGIAEHTGNTAEAARAEAARRAEQAEAALARVREACDQLQRASVLADGQPHADREHGVVQAVTRVLRAFTPPVPADGPEERS